MARDSATSNMGRGLADVYADVVFPANLKASLHLVLNFVVGLVSFIAVAVLLPLTIGFLIVLPLAVVTGWLLWVATRLLGALERLRLRGLLGMDIAGPARLSADGGFLHTLRVRAFDKAIWREIAYLVLLLPFGILSFTVTLVAWTVPIALIAGSVQATVFGVPLGLGHWAVPVMTGLIGIMLAAFIPVPIRMLADLQKAMGRALLGPSPTAALEEQVDKLSTSRARVADAAEDERRRIERDLHDGAQQRLVSLAMSLGMAKEKLGSDIDGARELVEEAHVETKRALVELRDLARGIHPAVLADRGLEAALTPVVALSPVPVALRVEVDPRPAARIESVAYFVVSEALANVAKHALATRAGVSIARRGERMVVEVTDDGGGGADPGGGGLAGLRHRVEGVDGWFSVVSPAGGPTTIMAELPCGEPKVTS